MRKESSYMIPPWHPFIFRRTILTKAAGRISPIPRKAGCPSRQRNMPQRRSPPPRPPMLSRGNKQTGNASAQSQQAAMRHRHHVDGKHKEAALHQQRTDAHPPPLYQRRSQENQDKNPRDVKRLVQLLGIPFLVAGRGKRQQYQGGRQPQPPALPGKLHHIHPPQPEGKPKAEEQQGVGTDAGGRWLPPRRHTAPPRAAGKRTPRASANNIARARGAPSPPGRAQTTGAHRQDSTAAC